MTRRQLQRILADCRTRVIGYEDAANDAERAVIGLLAQAFNAETTILLCQPSLARSTHRRPDVVVIDPLAGVHVVEVKGSTLDQIENVEMGGTITTRYRSGPQRRKAFDQVRNAMFDIKDAAQRLVGSDLCLPFECWVVFPSITESAWRERWGEDAFNPEELLFGDDLARV